jgi:hypothetical protein
LETAEKYETRRPEMALERKRKMKFLFGIQALISEDSRLMNRLTVSTARVSSIVGLGIVLALNSVAQQSRDNGDQMMVAFGGS